MQFSFEVLSLTTLLILAVTSFLTSLMTASLGAGGGVMMLGVMGQLLPVQVIIPVHGLVQLGSNAGRAIMSIRYIDFKMILKWLPGIFLGGGVGLVFLISLPPTVMYLSIAGFILFLCWGPKLPSYAVTGKGLFLVSYLTSFLGLFVGASGPLVGAFLKQIYQARLTLVSTFALIMSLQHLIKLLIFGHAGFDINLWLVPVAIMITSGAFGTWVGLNLANKIADKRYHRLFDAVLTLLALRLIWMAVDT
ncbi:MAG: sulfite exporter TauE/SafE family protein [Pseudomonadota bacterium]|nr:sulfite exporter TauE/SafE family protein [Pseudomonadota bacterium]